MGVHGGKSCIFLENPGVFVILDVIGLVPMILILERIHGAGLVSLFLQ
jgi:hypothetical protein